jgi:squalene synthase HpnC
MRQPFYNIYAFCRTADDVADESPTPQVALAGLEQLQKEIDCLFNGEVPRTGFFPALADTIATFQLSKRPFHDLLSAFRQDQTVTVYDTTEQLIDYCTRSANPVGQMVLKLADALDETTSKLSDQICTGLQLANFCQDVGRDFEIGRVYLPGDLRERFAVTIPMLSETSTPTELRKLLAHFCDLTEAHFRQGLPLVDHVPTWLSSDIKLFAHGGLATVQAIRAIEFDVLRVRPKVSKTQQLSLLARAWLGKL